jgi:hypothetical protein
MVVRAISGTASAGSVRQLRAWCFQPLGGTAVAETDLVGVPGGLPFVLSCASGKVATGIEGHLVGTQIDGLRLRCR